MIGICEIMHSYCTYVTFWKAICFGAVDQDYCIQYLLVVYVVGYGGFPQDVDDVAVYNKLPNWYYYSDGCNM